MSKKHCRLQVQKKQIQDTSSITNNAKVCGDGMLKVLQIASAKKSKFKILAVSPKIAKV